jgi:hypothetical protein
LTGGLIENAGTIEQLTVQDGMLKNETNASVTDLNVSGGTFHNAGNVDTLNLTGGLIENAGTIEQLTVQDGMLKIETNASVTDLNVSGGTFHNAGNVDTLNLTGGLIENAGTIEQLTVQDGMLKNKTNASVTNLTVFGGTFYNEGNINTLNLTGGKLTGSTSAANIARLNTGQNGVFDAAAYAGSSDVFSVTGGTLLITAGGDESQYTFSKVNVRQSVTLENAKIQVNAGDILTAEFTPAKLNEVYEIIKGQYDDKAFFDAAVGENITADLTSLWLNAGGKNMTVSKNDAENNTFSGKAEGIGTLTLQSGTLYLAGLETGTQIQAGSLVIENGALKSAAGINLGGSKKYTNVIQLTDSQTDIAGTVAKLNSNSSTALSKNMWSINGNHLDLTVETLTVGQFIEKQGKKLSGNAALIASVFDDVSVRQASKSANSLLARALPEYEYAEYRDSNGNELPGAVRTALENLGTDDAVNEAIHHALAGELAGNALRSASGPYRTVFRQHLDGLTLNRRSITQAVFPAEAQKTESPAAARPAAPLPAALPPRLTPRNTSGSKRDTGDLLLGQSGSSGIISMWFTPFVQSENADGDAVTYDGYKLSRSGFLVGGDYLIGHYAAAGAVFGYTDPTVKSTLGKITADDFSFGLYGRVPIFWGINTNMMIGFGSQSYTYANGAARSEFGGSSFFGSIEFSKKFYRQKISFMPLLAVDFQSAKMDEFNVTDNTLGNIAVAPGDFAATSLRLGLLGSYNGFHARLQYIRQMAGDDYVDSRTVFANYTGAAADIRSIRFGKDTVNFGIGGDILQTRRFKLSADYDLEAGTNITAHTGSLTAAVKW